MRSNGDRFVYDSDGYWWLVSNEDITKGPYSNPRSMGISSELIEAEHQFYWKASIFKEG